MRDNKAKKQDNPLNITKLSEHLHTTLSVTSNMSKITVNTLYASVSCSGTYVNQKSVGNDSHTTTSFIFHDV